MGGCLSKKSVCSSSTPVSVPEKIKSDTHLERKKPEEETVVKKEIFIIKHRKSHEIERSRSEEEKGGLGKKAEAEIVQNEAVNAGPGETIGGGGAVVRTSSCTKEEVDAILIQCGRLSRSSSTGKAAGLSESSGRKYSGSKRSYDFDNDNGKTGEGDDEAVARERENRHRHRHRQSPGRRRTPSRERERDQTAAQQRSGSRERGASGGGRRVSRSPGRRSESPITTNSNGGGANSSSSSAAANPRPGKMVSVPATVSSLAMDKSNKAGGGGGGGGEPNSTAAVKRIQVKRNAGGGEGAVVGTRTAASPRARSPARIRALNENAGQPLSLSRSNSRKAENSPYRRNPLAEIDTNIITPQAAAQKLNADSKTNGHTTNTHYKTKDQQQPTPEETATTKGIIVNHVGMNVISLGPESLKPNGLTRSRSSSLSRDLDISPETLSNPATSYTALLLEDIQNFHQKNTTLTPTPTPPPAFPLPPCLTKACSILEAVADLNSSTGSNTFSQKNNLTTEKKIQVETKEPFLESEVVVKDDLMEPSFHKYVTVRRGGVESEEQESSGSNSFVSGSQQQQWLSSSSWEPNSAESTDRWTSSSSSSRTGGSVRESGKRLAVKKRDSENQQQSGIGRGRIGSRSSQVAP